MPGEEALSALVPKLPTPIRLVLPLMQSSMHSFTHSLSHSLSHSLTHSLARSLAHSPTHSLPPYRSSLRLKIYTVLSSSLREGLFWQSAKPRTKCTSMPSSESRGIHPRRLQMRPTFTSTGNSCMRKHSSMMHATLLRPRPAPLKNDTSQVCCRPKNIFSCVTPAFDQSNHSMSPACHLFVNLSNFCA